MYGVQRHFNFINEIKVRHKVGHAHIFFELNKTADKISRQVCGEEAQSIPKPLSHPAYQHYGSSRDRHALTAVAFEWDPRMPQLLYVYMVSMAADKNSC